MEQDKFNIGEWIEKQKFWIGSMLLLFILVGSGILLWRENYQKLDQEYKLVGMENKILELESKVSSQAENDQGTISNDQKITDKKTEINQTDSNTTNSSDGGGKVAGVSTNGPTSAAKPATSGTKVSGIVNINTATAAELDSLPGIGPTYAQRIIDYRNANGAYASIDDVKKVKGIGDKTFDKFKDKITVQ